MKKHIFAPTANVIIRFNKLTCDAEGNPHLVLNRDKIESALHSAFYPGSPPFVHGGIAKLAGALCYYLNMAHAFQDGNKRTAVLAAITFMERHGWTVIYPKDETENKDSLADLVLETASGIKTKDDVIRWFENHKSLL